MPKWRTLDRRARPTPGRPTVGIQANKGNLSLNREAFEALGSPEAVEILYDPEEQLIGLKPTQPNARNYALHKQGVSNTWLVPGKALAQAMELDTSIARRYDVTIEDGVLVIDLKHDGTPAGVGPIPRR